MMLEKLYWAVKRIVGRGRGVVETDTGPVQLVQLQLSDLEISDQLPRIAEYGFQSCPPDGFTGVALFFGGDHSGGVVIATQHQTYRFQPLAKGEVALSDNIGQSVYLSATGIRITDLLGQSIITSAAGIKATDKAGSTVVMDGSGNASIASSQNITLDAPEIDLSSWACVMVEWPTNAAVPDGWLICPTAQTLVSLATYPRLAKLGTTWGGDGVTTVGLPYFAAGYVPIQGAPGIVSHGKVLNHIHPQAPSTMLYSGGGAAANGSAPYLLIGGYTSNPTTGGPDNLAAGMGVQFIIKY